MVFKHNVSLQTLHVSQRYRNKPLEHQFAHGMTRSFMGHFALTRITIDSLMGVYYNKIYGHINLANVITLVKQPYQWYQHKNGLSTLVLSGGDNGKIHPMHLQQRVSDYSHS